MEPVSYTHLTGYQGHVIPVVIAVFFMSKLEKKLHTIVPEMFDLFVTPLVTVLVTGYVTLTAVSYTHLERYARWCERTGVNHSLLLDFSLCCKLKLIHKIMVRNT